MALVLLIQPDKKVREKWEGVLSDHEVVCVSRLDEAVDEARNISFDGIIVDSEANFNKKTSNALDIFFETIRHQGCKKVCITSNKATGSYRSDGTLNFAYYNRFSPPDAKRLKFI